MTNEEFQQACAAAEKGNTEAMLAVAMRYGQGTTPADTEQMLFWLKKAAARGNTEAQEALAEFLKHFTSAAENGDDKMMIALAGIYLKGLVTEADYTQAVFWARKSISTTVKGTFNGKGTTSTVKDAFLGGPGVLVFTEVLLPARNFRELMEGAQKGNANFQYGLGFAYLKGFGTSVNPQQAVYWFQKASAQGHTGAAQALHQVQNVRAQGSDNFDQIVPSALGERIAKPMKKHPLLGILWPIILAAGFSYFATALDIGWLHSFAIFFNISWIIAIPLQIIGVVTGRTVEAVGLQNRGINKSRIVFSACLAILVTILVIGLSAHYIKGRKTGNPVSIILQNPIEAARKRFFPGKKTPGGKPAVEAVETPVIVTATVTSDAANIRSAPDSGKNNVIIQIKKGGILTVTGPVENDWLPVEVDGKPGYVSANLVRINDR